MVTGSPGPAGVGLLLRRRQHPPYACALQSSLRLCFAILLMLVFPSARRAEASRGCWWSPTGKSRRQARSLRSSSSVQTGEAAVAPEQVGSGITKAARVLSLCPAGTCRVGSARAAPCFTLWLVALGSEGCLSCCCHHGSTFRCPGEFEIFY